MNPASEDEPRSGSSRRMELVLESPRSQGDIVHRECVLRRFDPSGTSDAHLWYELPARLPSIAPDDAEPFLIAAIMDAMLENRPLHVHGRVSFQLLSNLHEFMAAWSKWFPNVYHIVETSADSVVAEPGPDLPPHDSAVVLHTGALDATSTIRRHVDGTEGHRTRRIAACAMIHGHLIPIGSQEKFDRGFELARKAIDSIGAPLYPVRTNCREVLRTHWSDLYGAAAISALYFFKPLARSCIISGSKAYDSLYAFPNGSNAAVPCGSNPFTNVMLSSASMQVLHDGSAYGFVEKAAIVAQWPEGHRSLRVCWRGSQLEPHCGICEECVRTKLAFMALAKPIPDTMGSPPTAREIMALLPMTPDCRLELKQVLAYCRGNGVVAPWVRTLALCLRLDRYASKFRHLKWLVYDRFR